MTEEQETIMKDFREWTGGFHPSEITEGEIEEYIECSWQTSWSDENKNWLREQGA